jgi:hypothetical protein
MFGVKRTTPQMPDCWDAMGCKAMFPYDVWSVAGC